MAEQQLSRLPLWLSRLLACLLVVCIAWQAAALTWMMSGYSPEKKKMQFIASQEPDSRSNGMVARPPLHLFGSVAKNQPVKTEKEPPRAPETRLKLKLRGVVISDVSEQSGAIVEEGNRKSSYYKVGETLPGNAELVAVFDDRILLRRSGRKEVLRFEDPATRGRARPSVQRRVSTGRQNTKKSIRSPEDFVEEAVRRVGQNPVMALSSVGLSAVRQGQADGYVFNGKNPMLTRLNLKKGDIIRSVNGHPLGVVQKDKGLIRELYQQGNLLVEVERDGTFFSVNYPLR
ncbi:MAG: general secretion pathway protein GspC [Proteobacteria bacterium]|nr:MAG: general secretion pathway protein GspC [Pseudomonadota bacterium]PIE40200.1 MAG: general secretion pathway protein GspC [Gammaproteobacteria bacterium]